MDKIKNIIRPGNSHDDETLYGSGQPQASTTKHHGGLTGEGSHFRSARDTTTGDTSGVADPQSSGIHNTAGSSEDHHLGGGAALCGGTAGLATHEHQKHETPQGSTSNTHSNLGNTQTSEYPSNTTTPHDSNLANRLDLRLDSESPRQADSGAPGASTGYSGTTQGSSYHTGPTGSAVVGHHQSDVANRLDPSLNSQGSSSLENAQHHSAQYGGGAEEADKHHTGRDTALGAGTVGGLGIAQHEREKHQAERAPENGHASSLGQPGAAHDAWSTGNQQGASYPGPAPNTAGPHKSDLLNRLDPRVDATTESMPGSWPNERQGGSAQPSTPDQTSNLPHHEKDSHAGRNTTLAGGAASGVAYEAGKHHDHNTQSLDPSSGDTYGGQAPAGGVAGGLHASAEYQAPVAPKTGTTTTTTTTTAAPHSSNLGDRAQPNVGSGQPNDQHYGQDAALVGGAGAAAYGAHEYSQKHDAAPNTTTGTATGPHSSNLANRADASTGSSLSYDHHSGRDAGLAGGAGAAGYGAYDQTHGATTGTAAGPHSSNLANRADPTIDSDRSKDHHYGRDAALVGGAGAAGGAAYGTHHHDPQHSSTTAGPHSSDLANRADPTVDSDRSKDKDHHYGRDAAVVGSVGGAAYAADKHNDEKDLKHAQKEAENAHERDIKEHEKEMKHAEHEAKKEHEKELKRAEKDRHKKVVAAEKQHEKDVKTAEREHEKQAKKEEKKEKGGLFGFLHRDKNKKYTAEEEAEFDRQGRENDSHKGRDAALGGAAIGGAGAYAAHEHDSHKVAETTTDKPLPMAPGNHGYGTGPGAQNALASDNSTTGHHGKHHGATPLVEKPVGKDLGDKLHGVERNRGVPGPTGFPSEPLGEHNSDQHGNPIGGASHQGGTTGHQSGIAGGSTSTAPYDSTSSRTGDHQTSGHHTGRDPALLGGAGAAVGSAGEHQYGKHDTTHGQQSSLNDPSNTTGQYDNSKSHHGLTGSHHTGHSTTNHGGASSLPRDNEYRTPGAQPDLTGSANHPGLDPSAQSGHPSDYNTSSGVMGESPTGPTSSVGRHKLRKDPPPSHPAAQAQSGGNLGGSGGNAY